MATYSGSPLWQFWYSYPVSGVFQGERFKNRYYITAEKAYDAGGKSLIFWSGDTIEFWVEPAAGERTLSLYVYAYSTGRVRASVYEEGNDTLLDIASNSTTEQWEKLELSFTADGSKNYFLRIEVLPYKVETARIRQKVYIDSLELQ